MTGPRGRHGLETLLFWMMALAGAVALVPALVLPPWLDYQAQLKRRQAAAVYLATLEERVRTAEKQVDRLTNDPAYILQLAEREFGDALRVPDAETIRLEPPAESPENAAPVTAQDVPLPELSAFVDELLGRYPQARFFVNPRTRPVLLGGGAVLLLAAILCFWRTGTEAADSRSPSPP